MNGMARNGHESLVDVRWLERHLDDDDLCVVDASWHLPTTGRDARGEYLAAHIPGAVFFDIDRIADTGSGLPHMLPEAGHFAREAGRLGIDNHTRVIVYDSAGLFSAARVWWMFRVFGHVRVAILDAGLPAWQRADLPLEAGRVERPPAGFVPHPDPAAVWTLADVQRNLETGLAAVIDARPSGRFAGTDPEPRAGLPSGHIPGARNTPLNTVIDPETGCVRPPAELRERFADLDERPVVCSCGTGVTACVLAFALHRLGREDVAVYDGSWTEWAGRADAPIETGPGDDGPAD